jgi:hypothetical protein
MWVSRSELRRLLAQISAAESRAKRAEEALAAERQSKDWLTLQLTSRLVTKSGQYGLDHEKSEPSQPSSPHPHPRGYTRDPTEIDLAKLEWYKQCAVAAGKDEDDALMKWEAEMRGEQPVYTYEDE